MIKPGGRQRRAEAWPGYVAGFHQERAGAIEAVLTRCRSGDHHPYRWLARAVSPQSHLVIDVASGAGPVARELVSPDRTVISIDRSRQELELVGDAGPAVQGDALRLPIQDNAADAAVSSMGLAVISPAERVLAEMARVVRPGGVVAVIGPTLRPMSPTDLREVALLFGAMRVRSRFPGSLERIGLSTALPAAGLRKVEDARERYRFTVASRADAVLLLNALYLPDASEEQVDAGVGHLERRISRRGPITLPVPMRRIVAIK